MAQTPGLSLQTRYAHPVDPKHALFDDRKKNMLENAANGELLEIVECDKHSEPIGFCCSSINHSNEGEINSLYVDKDFRSRGIGRRLVQRSLDWMDLRTITVRRVMVLAANENAMRLYEGFGFQARQIELITRNEKIHDKGLHTLLAQDSR